MGMKKEGALQHKPDLPCSWDEREGGAGNSHEHLDLVLCWYLGFLGSADRVLFSTFLVPSDTHSRLGFQGDSVEAEEF
ncbi:hypothetical protein SDJN03_30003, partial [Cucurbita argyrosperma subsp. sororia]